MRTIINYIRSCFCQHEWEIVSNEVVNTLGKVIKSGGNKAYSCKKCGYSKKYKSH